MAKQLLTLKTFNGGNKRTHAFKHLLHPPTFIQAHRKVLKGLFKTLHGVTVFNESLPYSVMVDNMEIKFDIHKHGQVRQPWVLYLANSSIHGDQVTNPCVRTNSGKLDIHGPNVLYTPTQRVTFDNGDWTCDKLSDRGINRSVKGRISFRKVNPRNFIDLDEVRKLVPTCKLMFNSFEYDDEHTYSILYLKDFPITRDGFNDALQMIETLHEYTVVNNNQELIDYYVEHKSDVDVLDVIESMVNEGLDEFIELNLKVRLTNEHVDT